MSDYKPPWETRGYQIAMTAFTIAMVLGVVMMCLAFSFGWD